MQKPEYAELAISGPCLRCNHACMDSYHWITYCLRITLNHRVRPLRRTAGRNVNCSNQAQSLLKNLYCRHELCVTCAAAGLDNLFLFSVIMLYYNVERSVIEMLPFCYPHFSATRNKYGQTLI